MRKKIVKIVIHEFISETRDIRELSCLHEMGDTEIIVVAKGEKNVIQQDFYALHTLTTRPIKYLPIKLNRILSVFLWAKYVRKLSPDIISCHDLIALCIGFISTIFLKIKPKLVYDSHEFELGRNGRNSKMMLFFIKMLEGFLIKKTAFSMMVNDTIADEVQRIYKLANRPIVVRNIPDSAHAIDLNIVKNYRQYYKSLYDFRDDDFIVLYHGAITSGRGIENTIMAMINTSGIKFIILGYGDKKYINSLKKLISANDLIDRVFFHTAVPSNELWKYVGAVDVGIVMMDNICLSYYYSLPNKFFQNIQANTPIIGSDFPEIKRVIEKYGIGVTCRADSPDDLRKAILKLKNDKNLYNACKTNIKTAAKELCWENEKKILINAYKEIL